MKVVCGLGNPGAQYEATRHNVGWWLVDLLADRWRAGGFRREGAAVVASARVGEHAVQLIKPVTYMNRSGAALAPLRGIEDFDIARDLLVVVDDATRPVGGVRFRPAGSDGGHKGLRSVEAVLSTRDYARLRIGVGSPPPDADLSDWVLSPFSSEDEEHVLPVLDELVDGVRVWLDEGVQAAMTRYNR